MILGTDTFNAVAPTVQAGVILRQQPVGNGYGFSLVPGGLYSRRETQLNRKITALFLNRRIDDFRCIHQIHGSSVVYRDGGAVDGQHIPTADAQWTDRPDLVLMVMVADCCPVVVASPSARCVGIAHAGWRGVRSRIVTELVGEMRSACAGNEELRLWIGPCAEGARYEVDAEFLEYFSHVPEAFQPHPENPDKKLFDIRQVLYREIRAAGIPSSAIEVSPGGTIGDRRYHSHRRDGFAAGRMTAYVTM